ncbi:MAG: hypothetical protein BMS9Abin36_1312 [Gammaproteobacteria bacterium]|nr:MAG: hypothetical protein BMS9Abin36_1312 [Gammaproteobacteria bacterium]
MGNPIDAVRGLTASYVNYFALLLPPSRGKAGMGVVLYGYMVPAVVFG